MCYIYPIQVQSGTVTDTVTDADGKIKHFTEHSFIVDKSNEKMIRSDDDWLWLLFLLFWLNVSSGSGIEP